MKQKIIITGATDGIGRVTARALARQGHSLVLVGRNPFKVKSTVEEMLSLTNTVVGYTADLSSIVETYALVEEIIKKENDVDTLVNNAGAFFQDYTLTKEGLESTFALNHLNYFIFALGMLPVLKKQKKARIVNVASRAHMGVSLDFANLQGELKYSGWKQYQKSKLMNIYFTYELASRLKMANTTVNCLHPGFVKTKFGHNNQGIAKTLVQFGQNLFAISEEKGAKTSIFLASDPSVENISGKYFVKSKEARSSSVSYDVNVGRQLWDYSESLLKHKFNIRLL